MMDDLALAVGKDYNFWKEDDKYMWNLDTSKLGRETCYLVQE